MKTPTIAIVGRPNVGKSAIFNRLAERQIAIVHDQPGVTRDRISASCKITDIPCDIIDTGGIGMELEDGFHDQVTIEADIAMESADVILFVVDSRDGLTHTDEHIAQKLRRAKSPVIMLLNKAENVEQDMMMGDFARLGLGGGLAISAAHGRGFAELADKLNDELDKVLADATEVAEEVEETITRDGLKIAIVGKPNAGKSSLVNAILKDERTIVSDIAGTTRDAIDIPYTFGEEKHTLIDTAGLRQRQKMDTSVEVFSAMRTEKSIRRADICVLVIDLDAGISSMDRKIAKSIKEERKPCLIILNKWDLFHPGGNRQERLDKAKELINSELFFLSWAPYACVSAREGQHISQIFNQITRIRNAARNPITTGRLNRLLSEAIDIKPPSQHKKYKKRVKLMYATAVVNDKYTAIPVPQFILFVNDKRLMHEHYEQYLANRIREQHDVLGVPIVFSIRSRNASKGKGAQGGASSHGDLTSPEE